MGLGISTGGGGGNFLDQVRYNTKEGRIYRVDSRKDASDKWERVPVEITKEFTAAVDIANALVGYMKFKNGVDFILVPMGAEMPPKPADRDYQAGFKLHLMLGQESRGSDEKGKVREIAGTAALLIEGIDAIVDEAMAKEEVANLIEVPVIELEKAERISSKHGGANFKPVFKIVGYVPRDDAFDVALEEPVEEESAPAHPNSSGGDPLPF